MVSKNVKLFCVYEGADHYSEPKNELLSRTHALLEAAIAAKSMQWCAHLYNYPKYMFHANSDAIFTSSH